MTDSTEPLHITVYSDYVCPWCYIGLQRIEQLQREYPVAVEWRPFELHPETPRGGADLRGRIGSTERVRAYADNIITLAAESGLQMHMPLVVANSHLALEAAEFAREAGRFEPYHRALFEAYFEDARDIGEVEVLCEIARACGLPDQRLRQALADEQYAAAIDAATAAGRGDEVVSTPTYLFEGGFRMTGAQDYAVFASVTGRLLSKRRGSEP